MADSPSPVKAACHCGAVKVTVPSKPQDINECQCTLCRRYGAAWAYYHPSNVSITVSPSTPTRQYVWGDREIEFHFCSVCGCVTHWKFIVESGEMGVNTRMMDPDAVRTINRRTSYGALKAPLKDKDTAHPDDQARYE